MQNYKRYAIYYVPESGSLANFGASWLGWNIETGETSQHPSCKLPVEKITRTARRYGLHGTIKPPFRLAEGTQLSELCEAMAEISTGIPPMYIDKMMIANIAGFLALIPQGEHSINSLANCIVRDLDNFRAPLTDTEIAQRQPNQLSNRQIALLKTWGYPYVMEEFRFHVTLSATLDTDLMQPTRQWLTSQLKGILPCPFPISSLCLVGESDDSYFRVLRRYTLAG